MSISLIRCSDGETRALCYGQTSVYVDRENISDAANVITMILPEIPTSLVCQFDFNHEGKCMLLNLSSKMNIWVNRHMLPCHVAVTLQIGDIVVIHSSRYSYVIASSNDNDDTSINAETYSTHTLETAEMRDWFKYFCMPCPRLSMEVSPEGHGVTVIEYRLASDNTDHALSFEARIEKLDKHPLPELNLLAEIAALAIDCCRRAGAKSLSANVGDCYAALSHAAHRNASQQSRLEGRETRNDSGDEYSIDLPDILAFLLSKLQPLHASYLLIQYVFQPFYQLQGCDTTNNSSSSELLASLLTQPQGQFKVVMQTVLLVLIKDTLSPPPPPPPARSTSSSEVDRCISDIANLVSWREKNCSWESNPIGHAATSPTSTAEMHGPLHTQKPSRHQRSSSFSSPTRSSQLKRSSRCNDITACTDSSQKSPPLSWTHAAMLAAAQSETFEKAVRENGKILRMIFSCYNRMQALKNGGTSTPRNVSSYMGNQQMSFASLAMLCQDFGISKLITQQQLKEAALRANNSRQRASCVSNSPRSYVSAPSISSFSAVFSSGPSLSFEAFMRLLVEISGHEEVRDFKVGVISVMNINGGKRMGLRHERLFIEDINIGVPVHRAATSPLPMRVAPAEGGLSHSPSALNSIKRKLLF